MTLRLGILATHPIQYYAPWYRALAARPELDVTVYYAHEQTAAGQASAGFGVDFEWDVPLLDGYRFEFLENVSKKPCSSTFGGCHTPSIRDRISRQSFDAFLVHGWSTRSYWQAIRACWRERVPVMVRGDSHLLTPRSTLKRWAKAVAYPQFVSRFDGYLVVGQRAREYYLAYGADPRRMFFCPHFVDNDRFAAAATALRPQRAELRRRWHIPDDALCLLFCGKFIAKKRPVDMIRAASQVLEQSGSGRPVHLLFVGSGELGPSLRQACRVVFDAEFTGGVAGTQASDGRATGPPATFAGFLNQSEIASAYMAADILVLPSDGGETWGLVVNEAMACGVPAVVSDQVGCAPDLVQEGESGFTYPCGDIDRLASLIGRLATERGLAERLGEGARSHIARYSLGVAADSAVSATVELATTNLGQADSRNRVMQ